MKKGFFKKKFFSVRILNIRVHTYRLFIKWVPNKQKDIRNQEVYKAAECSCDKFCGFSLCSGLIRRRLFVEVSFQFCSVLHHESTPHT